MFFVNNETGKTKQTVSKQTLNDKENKMSSVSFLENQILSDTCK